MKRIPSRHALRWHQATILQTLADLRAGRKVDHLPQEEVAQLIAGLEQRLVEVNRRLGEQPEA